MLVPVVGMSIAWLVLDEAISPVEAAGAAMVVGGVLLGSRRPVQPGDPDSFADAGVPMAVGRRNGQS
jgi:O-acetylserine/cysteine efflux transporter